MTPSAPLKEAERLQVDHYTAVRIADAINAHMRGEKYSTATPVISPEAVLQLYTMPVAWEDAKADPYNKYCGLHVNGKGTFIIHLKPTGDIDVFSISNCEAQ